MPSVLASVRVTCGLFTIAVVATLSAGPAFAQGPRETPSAPVTVVNSAANPVRVAGSVGVAGAVQAQQSGAWTVTAQETFAPGRAPKRYGPVELFGGAGGYTELVPPVAAGKAFIVTHLNAIGFSNIDTRPLVRGSCLLALRVGDLTTPFMDLPMVNTGFSLAATQQIFVPLAAGEALSAICDGVAADGTRPSQGARMTVGGYFVPAVQ
jgi:hypothetical protein